MLTCKADNCNATITDEGIPLVKGMSKAQMEQAGLPYIVIVQCSDCKSTFSTVSAECDTLPPMQDYAHSWYSAPVVA